MGKHVVVGSGQVGAHLAGKLLTQGHEVVVVTRSGAARRARSRWPPTSRTRPG
ncbi:NAD(P)-binding domain-containing protein [Nonomuraea thailandensis]